MASTGRGVEVGGGSGVLERRGDGVAEKTHTVAHGPRSPSAGTVHTAVVGTFSHALSKRNEVARKPFVYIVLFSVK